MASWLLESELEQNVIIGCNWLLVISGVAIFVIYCAGMDIQFSYGRYSAQLPASCGSVNARLAWFLQECPCVVIPVLLLFFGQHEQVKGLEVTPNTVLVSLYLLHYVQRTFIYSLCIKGGKPTPLLPLIVAFLFCCINGYLQSRTHTHYYRYDDHTLTRPHFIVGVVLFVLGMIINIHSDAILRNLRKPGEKGYKIPRGGVFELVSGANFFGESLEWAGYALSSCSFAAVAFAFFTVCYIGTRAHRHHKFYLSKFDDYPKTRKSFIPFIL